MYLFSETAFHHEGDKEHLLKLVDASKEAGVNGVKFQVLINLDEFMSSRHSSYTKVKTWILSVEDWREVFAYTKELNLDIIIMPLDIEAFTLVSEFGVKFIEIHSVSFNDVKLFAELEKYKASLILGTGGRTVDEIEKTVEKFKDRSVVLMVGFQSFPTRLIDVNIGKIKVFRSMFPKCIIGYADHSSFDDPMAITSNEYAYILGARVFEKHITINEGCDRVDFESALEQSKIKKINKRLQNLERLELDNFKALKDMNKRETAYRERQKIPVAKTNLNAGHVVSIEDLSLKVINTVNAVDTIDKLVGKRLKNDILKDSAFVKSL